MLWLFFVSLYFYAVFQFLYLFLLFYSIIVSYLSLKLILRFQNQIHLKRFFLVLGIVGNLLLLLVFKYSVQVYDFLNFLLGFEPCDKDYIQPPNILLPMGISFFTLQAISALVDVYRGVAEKPKNIFYFGLYLSFFPQLVAGPILRTKELIAQFYERKSFSYENFRLGLFQLCLGYMKKTLIADPISPYVDRVFASPWEFHTLSLWIAVFLFSIQIYGDFSGYSDIAIGTARIMGFSLPENFRRPFFSTTMSEFWRRWHISFSSWLRDYIYIPLGGSKVSSFRTYANLFITMIISGVWHGVGWHYLLWGSIHGFLLLFEKWILSFPFFGKINLPKMISKILGIFYTFWVFSFTFFFFRAKPLVFPENNLPLSAIDVGWYMTLRAFVYSPGEILIPSWHIFVMIGILFGMEILFEKHSQSYFVHHWLKETRLYFFAGLILMTSFIIYSVSVSQPFVYFQF
ncbi:MAG: MBOAT family O-acyltransferase [Leptospiraceae bacterium]|nr:MBOAT family O-acyltransferase [Leptospiraceae bacterium]